MRVPFGVVILAVLAVLAGVLDVLKGAQFLSLIAFGPVPAGNGNLVIGVLAIGVGIAWMAIGVGFFSLRSWAWIAGVLIAIWGLFEALATLLLTLSWEYAVATAVFPAIVLWYLTRERTRNEFGILDSIS